MKKRIVARVLWAGASGAALLAGVYAIALLWFVRFTTIYNIDDYYLEEVRFGIGGWFRSTSARHGKEGMNYVNFFVYQEGLRDSLRLTVAVLLLGGLAVVCSVAMRIQSFKAPIGDNNAGAT